MMEDPRYREIIESGWASAVAVLNDLQDNLMHHPPQRSLEWSMLRDRMTECANEILIASTLGDDERTRRAVMLTEALTRLIAIVAVLRHHDKKAEFKCGFSPDGLNPNSATIK
jgi:hypothetical protein